MKFRLAFTEEADENLERLENSPADEGHLKAVRKCLGLMETNLRHPSLNSHEYSGLKGPDGQKVFEAYAENKTPSAYRVFWYYGPGRGVITIVSIIPHP